MENLGGKGAALAQLVNGGFSVPETAVLTPAAYRRFVADTDLEAMIAALDEPDDAVIDALFLATALPADLASEIETVAEEIAPGGLVAVRSSATAEDSTAASFAGQYRSFLEVPTSDVVNKVRLTWASLWHRAPRTYRRHRAVPEEGLGMAVVLMRMVPARLAGVAFTVDPTDGNPDRIRIEAVAGLAESLVSGERTPDRYVSDRIDAKTLPEPLDTVATDALSVERYFGEPQDVEWAWDGTTAWIVQARPITALVPEVRAGDGFDTVLDERKRYTTNGIAEMLPGVLEPLVWEASSFLVEEAFNHTFDALVAIPPGDSGPHDMIGRLRGRPVLNLDRLASVASTLPGGSADELERHYVGGTPETEVPEPDPSSGGWRGLVHDVRVIAAQRRSIRDGEIVAAAYREMDSVDIDLTSMSNRALSAYRLRLIDLASRAMAAELGVAASAVAAYRRLELLLLQYLGEKTTTRHVQRVTTGAARSPLLPAALRVLDNVPPGYAESLPEEWAHARAQLEAEGQLAVVERFDRMLSRADSMAVFAGPTWRERPDRLWALCRAQALRQRSDTGEELDAAITDLEEELASSPGWRRTRWLTGQVLDVRLRLLRRHIHQTRDLLARRELVKQTVLDLGGRVRDIHLEFGARLTAADVLEEKADVDFLSYAELTAALAGHPPSRYVVGARRRAHDQDLLDGPLPPVFLGMPDLDRVPVPAGDRLSGWGAGPGRFTGSLRVVTAPDPKALDRDDVLAARTTDASWFPLFLKAGAIVVEQGGPLSHAAIVARELGLPAVMNIPGVIRRLEACPAGTSITVDGDKGFVAIHDGDARELP